MQLAPVGQMPDIVEYDRAVGSFFLLPGINGVVGHIGIDRDEARLEGKAVISNAVDGELMFAEIEYLRHIPFVLLAMFESFEETVAVRNLSSHPGPVRRVLRAPRTN